MSFMVERINVQLDALRHLRAEFEGAPVPEQLTRVAVVDTLPDSHCR